MGSTRTVVGPYRVTEARKKLELTAEITAVTLLLLACGSGMLLTVLQLPGNWLIAAAGGTFAWYFGWEVIGVKTALVLGALAGTAEIAEMLIGIWFTRKAGGSRRAAWWSLLGGLIGAFCLTIPVAFVGTVVGAAVGCFCGAMAAELSLNRRTVEAANVGVWSAAGRTLGTVIKVSASVMLAGIAAVSAILGLWGF